MGVTRGIFWPAFAVLLSSAASMALEIIAGRALAPYVGMSLYTWTMIIAVVLAGLSLGNWIGGVIADRTKRPERVVALALTAAAGTSLISLLLLRLTAGATGGVGPVTQVGLLAFAAFFIPSAFAGLLAPLLTVIALRATPEARRGGVLGLMFALGALGAILGTLLAGLVMISWLGTAWSVAAVAACYALLSLRFWTGRVSVGAGALSALAIGGALAAPDVSGLRIGCTEESRYFCIRVDDLSSGRRMRVMALDHLAHGVNDRDDPRLLWSPYVQGVDEIIGARFPGDEIDAFFIGGGAYTLPRAWAARYPAGRFTVAEIDPAVTRQAEERMWFAPDERTRILHADARRALTDLPTDARFDVIFGDAFHDISIPHHLVTDEFHAELAARLRPGGVYIANVVDALREPRFLLSLAMTLQAQFAHVELWMDVESIQPTEARTTWILMASDQATPRAQLASNYGPLREWVKVPLGDMVSHVGDDALVFLTDDFAPVDRLLSDVLLSAQLIEDADPLQ